MEARQSGITGGEVRLPESPRLPMEFLSRSWSASSLLVSKAIAPSLLNHPSSTALSTSSSIPEELANTTADSEDSNTNSGNASSSSSFASSAASQLVLERIMSERIMSCTEISPITSGRPSHSSGPLSGGSPMISPSCDLDDVVKGLRASSNGGTQQAQFPVCLGGTVSPGGGKTVGRWLKDRKEKKKEVTRAQNAQLHAAASVAGVAAAVAAMAAAAVAAKGSGVNAKNDKKGKLDLAVASAATLVAAQCVEAAEAMGVERDQLASVVGSAVNVRCYDDILTLTAAAATALRGAAALKARVMKDIQNAAVIPMGKELETKRNNSSDLSSGEIALGESPISMSDVEFLGTGRELLKRTRNGDLHWKTVSVYIHRSGEVMLKMKSKYVGGTITNKKKNLVSEVCKNMPAWPGRHLLEGGEQRRYFGLKTPMRVVEFECRDQHEHDRWTEGIARLLAIVAARKTGTSCESHHIFNRAQRGMD